jgi:hypothetical protein
LLQGPETDAATIETILRAIAAGEPVETDILNYRKNGETFWNRLIITPVRDATGVLTHFVSHQVDLTPGRSWRIELESHDAKLVELSDLLAERAKGKAVKFEVYQSGGRRIHSKVPNHVVMVSAFRGYVRLNAKSSVIAGSDCR